MSTPTDQRLYLAAPMQCYTDPRYDQALARLLDMGWLVADVRTMYESSAQWAERWPHEHGIYDAMAFLDHDGWIARGVDVELHTMRGHDPDVMLNRRNPPWHVATAPIVNEPRPVWWLRGPTLIVDGSFRLGRPTGNYRRWRRVQ